VGAGPSVPGGEDRRAAIDRRLEETFGAFDAAVRATQEQIARERAGQQSEDQQGPGGGPGEDRERGQDGDGATGSEAGSRGGLESVGAGDEGDGQTGGAAQQGSGSGTAIGSTGSGPRNIPPDIPDGSDDDIVARQIREAAMKETDPELREALWEEYRQYKKGQ